MKQITICGSKYAVYDIDPYFVHQKTSITFCTVFPRYFDCIHRRKNEWFRFAEVSPDIIQIMLPIPVSKSTFIKIPMRRCARCRTVYCNDANIIHWASHSAPRYIEISNKDSIYYRIEIEYRKRIKEIHIPSMIFGITLITETDIH